MRQLAVPFLIPILVLVVAPAALGPTARAADPLTDLLESGALAKAYSPVLLGYLLREGKAAVPDAVRTKAIEQLVTGLKQDLAAQRYAYYEVSADDLDNVETLVAAGFKAEAIAFLEDCVSHASFGSRRACTTRLAKTQPEKAFALLMAMADSGVEGEKKAGLINIGYFAAGPACTEEQRTAIIEKLVANTEGFASRFAEAAVDGLVVSKDARAAETLRTFTTGMFHGDSVKQAAQRGLLLNFEDQGAGDLVAKSLKGGMLGSKPVVQLWAAETLMLAGDDRGYQWATETLAAKRKGGMLSMSKGEFDPFRDTLNFLLVQPGERPARVFRDALAKAKGGDQREALLAIALAKRGDAGELARVRDALGQKKWDDRYRTEAAIALAHHGDYSGLPVLEELLHKEGGVFKKVDTEGLREDVAQALGEIDNEAGVPMLVGLLGDSEASTRRDAAYALLVMKDPAALGALDVALGTDFGATKEGSYTMQIHARILRRVLAVFAESPGAVAIWQKGAENPSAAVRFLALVGQQGASASQ